MALEAATTAMVASFDFRDKQLNAAVKHFLFQMDEGLLRDGASLSQIPTYVTAAPNGTEKGLYMAVDLGGTNFRVCSVQLNGDTTFSLRFEKYAVDKRLMVAPKADDLFDFLADKIKDFLALHHEDKFENFVHRRMTISAPNGYMDEETFRLGFTFSFPVRQVSINRGTLIRWTKGFDIPDAIGKDVCELLQNAIDRRRLPVKVAALVNDTVGTLMARSYKSPGKTPTLLGAIFGTGTNGAYMEKLANIKKPVPGEYDASTGLMVVNSEWGSFDNELRELPNTTFDQQLDAETPNPGVQMYEKRVSGMFLGELLRLALRDMQQRPELSLFQDDNSSTNDWGSTTVVDATSGLLRAWGVDTAIMSVAAADTTPELSILRQTLEKQLRVYSPALEDARAFKRVSDAIGRRAARLSAIAIAAVVLKSGQLADATPEDPVDIGADGSLVEHYPFFRDMIFEALRAIDGIGEEGARRIRIGIAKDGSGVGAALIALVAAGMEKAGPEPNGVFTRPGGFLRNLRETAKVDGDITVVHEEATAEILAG